MARGLRAVRQAEEVQVRPRAKGRESKSDGEKGASREASEVRDARCEVQAQDAGRRSR